MKAQPILDIDRGSYTEIVRYVLPGDSRNEEAVFVFARVDDIGVFTPIELYFVPPEGFVHRSPFFLELTDDTRAAVIKRAHDLTASVLEIHSHPSQFQAEFSESDIRGFHEFVPHMLWRLKRRPYAAIVVARSSFDSLAWFESEVAPVPMVLRFEDGAIHAPTGTTHSTWGQEETTYE
ncbi:MAG: hypothetical protein CMJ46_07245 [Planctomyces sp.]|nr:hypothetical protein [Planctomyces sp.]